MNGNVLLAIVIPAYKSKFLEAALDSICGQTDKRFRLYIGDDNSPENLYDIISKYEGRLPLIYKHFDDNLGCNDLIAHWERCIDLVQDEEYIWFFSDDDMMEKTCVADFYHEFSQNPNKSLYHFNTKIINSTNTVICPKGYDKQDFPYHITQEEYAKGRLYFKFNSFAVEYIFSKDNFFKLGRFVKIDLAWGSDDATWLNLSKSNGIYTIAGSKVMWRITDVNISPSKSRSIVLRKLRATLSYLSFVKHTVAIPCINDAIFNYWLHSIYNFCKFISWKEVQALNRDFIRQYGTDFVKRKVLYFISFVSRHL